MREIRSGDGGEADGGAAAAGRVGAPDSPRHNIQEHDSGIAPIAHPYKRHPKKDKNTFPVVMHYTIDSI